ncbi:MAG: autotransporter-associated beta strand repeat-containing protein, partial [Kiritimatiellae bacterium]|nr:autotransporter-associated beta strand repeat-containing protein [Kiritimatiellia bacterium]
MRLNLDTPATPILLADWMSNPNMPYAGDLTDGGWHHVAVVYTGEQFNFYINGILVRSFTETSALSLTAGNFRIGNGWLSGATYEGLMDDFMMADWAMSSGELYAVRVNGQEPDTSAYAVDNMLPATAAVEVGFNGSLRMQGDQTVATLGGAGAAGGVYLQNDGTLTVNGSASATSTVFRSGIAGNGGFVKRGVDYTLTLSGGHSYTGATEIQEGTLILGSGLDAAWLQAHYRFNDAAQLGKDSSGNGYHLTPGNSPMFTAAGKDGGAAQFSTASKDTLAANVFPATLPTGNSSYTMTAWCNPSSGNTIGMPVYWGASSSSTYGSGVLFRFASATGILVSNFGNNQTVEAGYDLFTQTLNGGWHHFACTYDGATRTRRVYIDGVLKYTGSRTTDLVVSDQVFLLGGAPYSTANYYDGLLDEVMIFNRALNDSEIQQAMELALASYTPIRPSANLVARYSFEDVSNPGKDSSANGYDLAPFGSAGVSVSGKRGKALDLSGATTGYLSWTNSVFPEMMPTGNQAMTVSAWINPVTGADTDGSIVFWGDESAPTRKSCHLLRLRGDFASGRIGISYTDRVLPNLESDAVNGLDRGISPEGWHHVAVVYAGGRRALYLDGVKVAEDLRSALEVTDGSFYIGRKETLSTKWFQGMLDEVEIYNRALSHAEVLELLRGGADILPAGSALNVAEEALVEIQDVAQQVAALNGAGTLSFGLGMLTVAGQGGVFAGALTGEGLFAVRDGAVQTLAGAGTFSGALTVSNATLLVENASGLATGAGATVAVHAGGVIGGAGALAGEVVLENGAVIAGGETLTVSGSVTLAANGVVSLPQGFTAGTLTLFNATSVTAPDGVAGWAVEPQPSASTAVAFTAEGT